VIDDYKVLNDGGLRYDDEIAKHKILDAIGDMLVIGQPLIAAYSAYRSGHELNNKLLRKVLAEPSAFEFVSFDDAAKAPAGLADLAPAW
jgi:UDP-3-O-[3-hydroxymyristoyl] N-acetylglucosamine deacetylase